MPDQSGFLLPLILATTALAIYAGIAYRLTRRRLRALADVFVKTLATYRPVDPYREQRSEKACVLCGTKPEGPRGAYDQYSPGRPLKNADLNALLVEAGVRSGRGGGEWRRLPEAKR
jgi:hypothetical protein